MAFGISCFPRLAMGLFCLAGCDHGNRRRRRIDRAAVRYMHVASFCDAAEIWALFAAFIISPLLAAIAFLIGLFGRIAASDLARLASPRAPAGRAGVTQA